MTYAAGTESRAVERLGEQQAALRRVATLVAEGAPAGELFAAVAREVGRVLDVPIVNLSRYEPDRAVTVLASWGESRTEPGTRWPLDGPSVSAAVLHTGSPARIDDHTRLPGTLAAANRESGLGSLVGAPIIAGGHVWGIVRVASKEGELLPADTEDRLSDFTDLVALAITNAAARDRVQRLADEQGALRHVAVLVAQGATISALCTAVVEEIVELLAVPSAWIVRYEPDHMMCVVAVQNDEPGFSAGSRWPLEGESLSATIYETGRPARIDDFTGLQGPIAERTRASGIRTVAGVPITVDGSLWGFVCVGAKRPEQLPADTEARLLDFTALVETSISNALAHEDLHKLAAEQAALRRVATLVARAASTTEVVTAVAEEAARVFDLPAIEIVRYEGGGATVLANSGGHLSVGSRWPLDGPSIMEAVLRTGAPARIVDYTELTGAVAEAARRDGIRAALGAPIVVDGGIWGSIIAISTTADEIPQGAEIRLSMFTDLVATAVSNLQAHDDLRGLAGEQAALRRVATLVAEGATVDELFYSVATEVAQVVGVSAALLDRFLPEGTAITLAASYDPNWREMEVLAQSRTWPPDPGSLTQQVHETGRPARVDDYSGLAGVIGASARAAGVGSGCSAPIHVDGRLWGAIRVFSRRGADLPADTEGRLQSFTELVGTAISNAAARADLIASRARIVAAGDEARRRIERNLHDGTQQRLIALGLDLRRIRSLVGRDEIAAKEGLERMGQDLESVLEDVRELSRGLHPPLLSRAGLLPSLRAVARRSPIPVDIDIDLGERPPPPVEIALYYVVSEALTNAIKHSKADAITVTVETDHGGVPFGIGLDGRRGPTYLHATIVDDGIGGAVATEGSGLMGLADRVDALGGKLVLESPPGEGTRISIELPLAGS